jgi:butyryl-CoA dehydrogenase
MDLLGRKVIMQNAQALMYYVAELQDAISAAEKYRELEDQARQLSKALTNLQEVTKHLLEIAQSKGPEFFLADATLYLELFGIITIAWQWLRQGIAIQAALRNGAKKTDLNFYQGKMFALNYFFGYELPKTLALSHRLMNNDALTVEMETAHFSD